MTLATLTRQAVKQMLPAPALRKFKELTQFISPLELTAPVLQMYIDDGNISTHICINNFYSFLAPSVPTTALLEIIFYGPDGRKILTIKERLEEFQSRFFDVQQALASRNIKSSLGVVTVQLSPDHPRREIYKRFGQSSAHFFQYYRSINGSVSMIHPSSLADPENKPSGPWVSNQTIATENLQRVVLYQCNPSFANHKMRLSLQDAKTGTIIAAETVTLAPLATHRIDFDLTSIENIPEHLNITVDAMPSSNSKPMLCRIYKDGKFSMSHS